MKLIEMDAKKLLAEQNIHVPSGFVLPMETTDWPVDRPWNGPCYLKAQVVAGRRGKNGLVQRVGAVEEFPSILENLKTRLSSQGCEGFWCEEAYPHEEEWFLACDVDRARAALRVHVSRQGGKEVSAVQTYAIEDLSTLSNEVMPAPIRFFLEHLGRLMTRLDAVSIEINPAILRDDQTIIALDAKVELDDAAAFRHPEWQELTNRSRWGEVVSPRERAYVALLQATDRPLLGTYVELEGTIAMVLAGGGASLVAMDALAQAGGKAANYLELSGNPDPDFLRQAVHIVLSHPMVRALWVAGSFANFTDIQATVAAVLQAVEEKGLRVPIVIRRDGPHADLAEEESKRWARERGISLLFHRGDVDLFFSAQEVLRLSQE